MSDQSLEGNTMSADIQFLSPDDIPPSKQGVPNMTNEPIRQALAENVGTWAVVYDAPWSAPESAGMLNSISANLRYRSPQGHPELKIEVACRSDRVGGYRRVYARAVYVDVLGQPT